MRATRTKRGQSAGMVALPLVLIFLGVLAILAYALDQSSRSALDQVYRAHVGQALVAEAHRRLFQAQMSIEEKAPPMLADGSRTQLQEEILQLTAGGVVKLTLPMSPPTPGVDVATDASDVTATIRLVDGDLTHAFDPRPIGSTSASHQATTPGEVAPPTAQQGSADSPDRPDGAPAPVTLRLVPQVDLPQGVHVRWFRRPSGCGYWDEATGLSVPPAIPATSAGAGATATATAPIPVQGRGLAAHDEETADGAEHHAWIAIGTLTVSVELAQRATRLATTRIVTETKLVAFNARHRVVVDGTARTEKTQEVSMAFSPYYLARRIREVREEP